MNSLLFSLLDLVKNETAATSVQKNTLNKTFKQLQKFDINYN